MNLENLTFQDIADWVVPILLDLALAIVVLLVGLWVVKRITKVAHKTMEKKDVDPSLRPFLRDMLNALLTVILVVIVISMLGVETASLIAVLGAAGFAVGLALSGTLQNFAGGVIILIIRPYKVGDFIEAQGYSGTVEEIQIFNTILKTPANQIITIPNGPMSTGTVKNYSTEPTRRMDLTFGIGYSDDIDKAKKIISDIILNDERVLKDPEPMIAVSELADSSVNIVARPWFKNEDFWGFYWEIQEKVKKEFDAQGVSIPFPQMDVHLDKLEG